MKNFLGLFAGITSAMTAVTTAFEIQWNRRTEEQSINARFEEEREEMRDSMEKNPKYAQANSD